MGEILLKARDALIDVDDRGVIIYPSLSLSIEHMGVIFGRRVPPHLIVQFVIPYQQKVGLADGRGFL